MADAWFKFYPSDWLAETRDLTPAEAGVYITLIALMYENYSIVHLDDKRLARICNCGPASFQKILKTLIDDGKVRRVDGGLTNDRVRSEMMESQ